MNPFAEHAAGLGELTVELGDECPTFQWGRQTYKALPGGANRKRQLDDGGYSLDADLAITCDVAQFGKSAIALQNEMPNTELTYLTELYRVVLVSIAPGGHHIRIEANSAHV